MFVLRTSIDMQTSESLAAKSVVGEHALDSLLDDELGLLSHQLLVLDLFEVTDVTGVMVVHFLIEFFTGQNDFIRIDDDDEIAGVNMRSEDRFVFAAEKSCGFSSKSSRVLPSASSRYHLRSTSLAFGI